jgi:osmotically-inducible protein OsmY
MIATKRLNDEEIGEHVRRALSWDSRVEHATVGVVVHEGVVTLMGTTTSYAKKLAAEEAAHRVPGVLDVADELQVIVPGSNVRTDTEIVQAVRLALEWNDLVPHDRIRSTVADGWVTLEGTVDLLREGDDAERAVRDLKGVRGVINKIVIGGPEVDAQLLREGIAEALARHAQREARHIDVKVEHDTVTLSGRVDSWVDKRAVLGVVRHTPGVRALNDGLEIDPYSRGSWSAGAERTS